MVVMERNHQKLRLDKLPPPMDPTGTDLDVHPALRGFSSSPNLKPSGPDPLSQHPALRQPPKLLQHPALRQPPHLSQHPALRQSPDLSKHPAFRQSFINDEGEEGHVYLPRFSVIEELPDGSISKLSRTPANKLTELQRKTLKEARAAALLETEVTLPQQPNDGRTWPSPAKEVQFVSPTAATLKAEELDEYSSLDLSENLERQLQKKTRKSIYRRLDISASDSEDSPPLGCESGEFILPKATEKSLSPDPLGDPSSRGTTVTPGSTESSDGPTAVIPEGLAITNNPLVSSPSNIHTPRPSAFVFSTDDLYVRRSDGSFVRLVDALLGNMSTPEESTTPLQASQPLPPPELSRNESALSDYCRPATASIITPSARTAMSSSAPPEMTIPTPSSSTSSHSRQPSVSRSFHKNKGSESSLFSKLGLKKPTASTSDLSLTYDSTGTSLYHHSIQSRSTISADSVSLTDQGPNIFFRKNRVKTETEKVQESLRRQRRKTKVSVV